MSVIQSVVEVLNKASPPHPLAVWYMDAEHVPKFDDELGLVKSRIKAFIIWSLWDHAAQQNTNLTSIRTMIHRVGSTVSTGSGLYIQT